MIVLFDPYAYQETIINSRAAHGMPIVREERFPLFVYYSFCTMTTLGYGDVIPISRIARSISWLEALSGQLYLAILVSRLVGLHIAEK